MKKLLLLLFLIPNLVMGESNIDNKGLICKTKYGFVDEDGNVSSGDKYFWCSNGKCSETSGINGYEINWYD